MKNRTKPRKDLKTERALTIVNRGALKKENKEILPDTTDKQ